MTSPPPPAPPPPTARAADADAHVALPLLVERYLAHLFSARGRSAHTVAGYGHDLAALSRFLAERGRRSPASVTAADLAAFVQHLTALGRKPASVARAVSATRQVFLFALRAGWVAVSPAKRLKGPRRPPRALAVGTPDAIRALIAACHQTAHPARRLRDVALMELLYGAGLRASEICALTLDDLDRGQGLVAARDRDGRARWVPMGRAAQGALARYLDEARPRLAGARGSAHVFVGRGGRPMGRVALYTLVRRLSLKVPSGQALSPHALRHACAAHLLGNGADLRAVQEMLGHQSIATTEIYAQPRGGGLEEAVERCHPLGAGGARAHPRAAALLAPLTRAGEADAGGA